MPDDNIQFEAMPDFGNIFTPQPQQPETREREYDNLYDELRAKCWPENFMNPYDTERVAISNHLYSQILQFKNDEEKLNDLRREATELLGIKFNGRNLYERLIKYFNPREYLRPYNPKSLEVANKYYLDIESNKKDYVALENIANQSEVAEFIKYRDELSRHEQEQMEQEQSTQPATNEYDEHTMNDIMGVVGDQWQEYIEQ